MSNITRLSDSTDDDPDDPPSIISSANTSHNMSYLQNSSSDSDDLDVVESAGTPQSTTYDNPNSQGEDSPFHISNFYNQHNDNYTNEQEEPSYSLDVPSNGDDFSDLGPNYDSCISKKSSKKKKEKSNRSNNPSPVFNKKSSKRKNASDDSHSRHSKKSKSENKEKYSLEFHSENVLHTSNSFDNVPMSYYESNQTDHGYMPEYSSSIKSPDRLPDLSEDEEIPSFRHYGRKEEKHRSPKKIDRLNSDKTDLKKRLDSSNKGNLLMQKMGYREGEGLGKHAQGRTEPVELSKQKGRRGLGLSLPGLDDNQAIEWDPSIEVINVHEPIEWLENHDYDILDYETMVDSWLVEGPKNLDIGTMTDFVDEYLLRSILHKKSLFDNLSDDELQRTIVRSNPFETIRKGIFMNRAAIKMANIDSAFDFMFTAPRKKNDAPMVQDNELLYFADVCAGPGGFSEYVLWRKKWRAKGIGFTLKGDCDFKIHDFNAGPSETFEPFYGAHKDGNIYDPENITSLTEFVMKITDDRGVHFMMADGGFSVKGQENIQELLSKQLYLCQFLVALSIVREEGHFVCKLFDLFSPFSAGLIYLIYRAFDKICIFKPNSSRPANSERYIICKHRKRNIDEIRQYLYHINEHMWKLGTSSDVDIIECVPVAIIKENIEFFKYLKDSNNKLGNQQDISLDKVIAYYKDPNLHELQQNALRKQCMDVWRIPPGPRKSEPNDIDVTTTIFKDVFGEKYKTDYKSLNMKGVNLNSENLEDIFKLSILDWECVPLGSDKLVFLLGLGKNRVYQWVGSRWDYEDKVNIELPPGTLVYGEFVPEFKGEGMKQKKIMAFHIIDALALGYEVISNYPYSKRISILNLFAEALKKSNNNTLCPIRVKSSRGMKDINEIFSSVVHVLMKGGSYETCLRSSEYNHALQMKGICFIRTTREPWRKHLSKKTNLYYFFNSSNGQSFFENDRPKSANASTIDSLKTQVLWMWEAGVGFKGEGHVSNVLHKDELLSFISRKC